VEQSWIIIHIIGVVGSNADLHVQYTVNVMTY